MATSILISCWRTSHAGDAVVADRGVDYIPPPLVLISREAQRILKIQRRSIQHVFFLLKK